MYVCVYIITDLFFYLNSSVQVICHFNILLTEAGGMHEAGYVYSICSTKYHFSIGYFTSVLVLLLL